MLENMNPQLPLVSSASQPLASLAAPADGRIDTGLQLRLATRRTRFLASVMDFVLVFMLSATSLIVVPDIAKFVFSLILRAKYYYHKIFNLHPVNLREIYFGPKTWIWLVVFCAVYFIFNWLIVKRYKASLGMLFFEQRVIEIDAPNQPKLAWRTASWRAVLGLVATLAFPLGIISALWTFTNAQRRSLIDIATGTKIMQYRFGN